MTRVKCKDCGIRFELDIEAVKNDRYIQCPNCGGVGENAFYENNEKE